MTGPQPIHSWLGDKASPGLQRQIQKVAELPGITHMAVMADAHEGPDLPNGLVCGSQDRWYPALVGSDMGCGLSALAFGHSDWHLGEKQGKAMLRALGLQIPGLKHGASTLPQGLPETCQADAIVSPALAKAARRDGLREFGTLGRGNHFIELARDDANGLWALVHSGSRVLGQIHYSFHEKILERDSPTSQGWLLAESKEGAAWYHDAQWLIRYASESRLHMINRIADIIAAHGGPEPDPETWIDCPHNFPSRESQEGRTVLVHRKSANAAHPGELGIIPGSMATGSRIVRGLGNPAALYSSSHGAGRIMSRAEAFQRLKRGDLERTMEGIHYQRALAGRILDEAPQAYRNLDRVMASQADLVRTVFRLRPVLNDKRV